MIIFDFCSLISWERTQYEVNLEMLVKVKVVELILDDPAR